MDTEDTLSLPPLPSKDEKGAQKVPDHPHKNGTLKATHKWAGFQGKTLWDWLQLLGVLAIPLVVVGATIAFNIQQANLAQQQHDADQKRTLDQQQAAILQTYIDNIQDLLLNHNLQGRPLFSKDDPGGIKFELAKTIARARTLTALRGLDPQRKGLLVLFLYDARLIDAYNQDNGLKVGIVKLVDADLSGSDLINADLSGADLSGADLRGAHLYQATLSGARLDVADLSGADLRCAGFEHATLYGAILKGSDLADSNITQQQVYQAKTCISATVSKGLICEGATVSKGYACPIFVGGG
jgi:uncharacterized protein YjbI with pentapeptide repeats